MRQQPDSCLVIRIELNTCNKLVVPYIVCILKDRQEITWPDPVSFGHFGPDLHFAVLEVEGFVTPEPGGLYGVDDVFRGALSATPPELVTCA